MTNAERTLQAVRELLTSEPGLASQVLQAVTDGLKDYEEAQRTRQDALADKAFLALCAAVPTRAITVVNSVDMALYHFPHGCSGGYAPAEVAFWDAFVQVAKRTPLDRQWFLTTRGSDALKWWDTYVNPPASRETP